MPVQIKPGRLTELPQGNLFPLLAGSLGELVQWVLANPTNWIDPLNESEATLVAESTFSEASVQLWRSAVARDLLLLASIRFESMQACRKYLSHSILQALPFGGQLSLEMWFNIAQRSAAAIFPLANSNPGGSPGIGQAWVFCAENMPESLPCSQSQAATRLVRSIAGEDAHALLLFSEGDRGLVGDSWQLAAGLAARALEEGNPNWILEVASKWIASGVMDGKNIRPVKVGNKPDIIRTVSPTRKALLPGERHLEWPLGMNARFTHHLNTAWAHVCGIGILDGTDLSWPVDGVDEIHQLVGGFPGVNIATPLLFKHDNLTLWVSDDVEESIKPGRLIAETLAKITGKEIPPPVEIDAGSLTKAEHQLRKELEQSLIKGKQIVFNITSGNRLMSYAVHSLARLYSNLWLIYKEKNSPNDNFTRIAYEGDYPVTSPLRLPATPAAACAPYASDALKQITGFPRDAPKTSAFWTMLVSEGLHVARSRFSVSSEEKNTNKPENPTLACFNCK